MTHARRTLIAVGALTLTVAAGIADASASPTLPAVASAATTVEVQPGKVTRSVDLAVTDAAAITGTVRAAGSAAGRPGVLVTARDAAGHLVGTRSTTRYDGRYLIVGLPRSTSGFAVCVTPTKPAGGPAYGYAGRCYGTSARFLGGAPPSNATFVTTVPGTTRSGIDLVSSGGGAIEGRVGGAGVGDPTSLRNVTVRVYDLADRLIAVRTGAGGKYALRANLPAGSYHVCVDARQISGAAPNGGFAGRCYGSDASWVPGRSVPAGARTVVVAASAATTHVDVGLVRGGAVSGTVTTTGGRGITGARVVAYRDGRAWASAQSSPGGGYRLRGLPSGTFRVCASRGETRNFNQFYGTRCVLHVGTTRLSTHAGVDLRLQLGTVAIGTVVGTVRDTSRRALGGVQVEAFSPAGRRIATATTGPRGHYALSGIRASAQGYRVCFSGDLARPAGAPRPSTGYEARCYAQVRWNRGSLPTGRTTLVSVAGGRTHRGVDATLGRGGTITGRVTYRGAALLGAAVYVADANRREVRLTTTDSSGRYSVEGLTPSTLGYLVCAIGGTTRTAANAGHLGYRGRCTGDVAWDPVTR